MSAQTYQPYIKFGELISMNSLFILGGITVCFAFSLISGNVFAADPSNDSSAQQTKSAAFQKRMKAEQDAEDQRDRDYALQEQARKEEAELTKMRAERAAARNARVEAAKQQEQQQSK